MVTFNGYIENTSEMIPIGIDWLNTYMPAALAMWHGQSPYGESVFYAAPWSLIPLIPFALMPYDIGRWGVFIFGFVAFAFTAFKLGTKPLSMIIFLTSAAVIGCLNNGNIEWMPLLGFVMPPWLGLIFVMIKPQVGIGIAVYWFIEAWRNGGIKQAAKTFAPVTIAFLISFWLYGLWPLRFQTTLDLSVDNTSLFPNGIFVGLVLLAYAIRKNEKRAAMASGPFLAPYVLQFTWSAPLVVLVTEPWLLFVAWVGLWIPVMMRILNGWGTMCLQRGGPDGLCALGTFLFGR